MRKTLTIFSLFGLVLSVGLWFASYFNIAHSCFDYNASLSKGSLAYAQNTFAAQFVQSGATKAQIAQYHTASPSEWTVRGYTNLETTWLPDYSNEKNRLRIELPMWIPSLLFSGLPIWALVSLRRSKQALILSSTYNIKEGWARRFCARFCAVGFAICLLLWLFQLPGPLLLTEGPCFENLTFAIHGHQGLSMKFAKPPTFRGGQSVRIQEPNERGEEVFPPSGSYWLVGLGHGLFHSKVAEVSPLRSYGAHMIEKQLDLQLSVRVPLLLSALAFLFFVIVLSFVPLYLRRARGKHGLCANCGYDLRASNERCPECGAAIELDKAPQLREDIVPKENEIDETNLHDHGNGGGVERGG